MPLILPGNVASATAATSFSVDNSCRFNGTDAKLSKSLGAPSDADKFTWSFWIKRGNTDTGDGNYRTVIRCWSSTPYYTSCTFEDGDVLSFGNRQGSGAGGHKGRLITNRVFRDSSAWYHIVCVWDSGNATAGDRMKMYVNGVEETSFSTDTNPTSGEDSGNLDGNTLDIGVHGTSYWWDGYMAEVYFCDGQAYGPTDFGEFDSDSPTIWKPKDASGLTFGNNGFYLDFKDSANLGNDANGGTDLTETNIAAADQATDTPTNNFATMNPLDNYYAGATFSEGNCKIVTNSSNRTWNTGTIGLTAGKWYWEVKATEMSSDYQLFGISDIVSTSATRQLGQDTYSYGLNGDNGTIYNNSSSSSADWEEIAQGDIIGHYLDLDNNKMYWGKNGTVMNSGTGFSITAAASTGTGFYLPAFGEYAASDTLTAEANFGGCSAFTVSSAVADANGYGAFEYNPSSGTFDGASKDFLAICTKNLGSDGG